MTVIDPDKLAELLVTKAAAVRRIKTAIDPISGSMLAGAAGGALLGGGTAAVGPKKKKNIGRSAMMGATAGAGVGLGVGALGSAVKKLPKGTFTSPTSVLPPEVQAKLPDIAEQLDKSDSPITSPISLAVDGLSSYTKEHPILATIAGADAMSHLGGAAGNMARRHTGKGMPSMRVSDLLEGLEAAIQKPKDMHAEKDGPQEAFAAAKRIFSTDSTQAKSFLHRMRTAIADKADESVDLGYGLRLKDVKTLPMGQQTPLMPKFQPMVADDVVDFLHWVTGKGNPADSTGTRFSPAHIEKGQGVADQAMGNFLGTRKGQKDITSQWFGIPEKLKSYSGKPLTMESLLADADGPTTKAMNRWLTDAMNRPASHFMDAINAGINENTTGNSMGESVVAKLTDLIGKKKNLSLRSAITSMTTGAGGEGIKSRIQEAMQKQYLAHASKFLTQPTTEKLPGIGSKVMRAISGLELGGRAKTWAGAIAPRAALYGGVPVLQSLLSGYLGRASEQGRLNKLIQDAMGKK